MTLYFILLGLFAVVILAGIETAIVGMTNRDKRTLKIAVILFAAGIAGLLITGLAFSA